MFPIDYLYGGFLMPFIPVMNEKPPTVYSILNSIVNGDKDEDDYSKIKDLAKEGRQVIFNFEYPLTQNITKEKFECMILNHYLMRRIGFETVTAFRIALDVKLNEIMPFYNKMFDAIQNWDIFNDGETINRSGTDNSSINSIENNSENSSQNKTLNNIQNTTDNTSHNNSKNYENEITDSGSENTTNSSTNSATNSLTNTATNTVAKTLDRRYNDTPENQIVNVQNGSYLTDYTLESDNSTATDNSSSQGTSSNTANTTDQKTNSNTSETSSTETENFTEQKAGHLENQTTDNTSNSKTGENTLQSTDQKNYNETINKTNSNKIEILKEMQENIKSIYSLIFKDLDNLFYSLL